MTESKNIPLHFNRYSKRKRDFISLKYFLKGSIEKQPRGAPHVEYTGLMGITLEILHEHTVGFIQIFSTRIYSSPTYKWLSQHQSIYFVTMFAHYKHSYVTRVHLRYYTILRSWSIIYKDTVLSWFTHSTQTHAYEADAATPKVDKKQTSGHVPYKKFNLFYNECI